MVAPACLAQSLGKESFVAFVALVGKLGAPEDVAGCGPHVQKAWYVMGFHYVCFAQVILSPLAAGTFFGVQAVFGLLTGSLGSSVQLAISMSNSGGAWDNCTSALTEGLGVDQQRPRKTERFSRSNSTARHPRDKKHFSSIFCDLGKKFIKNGLSDDPESLIWVKSVWF